MTPVQLEQMIFGAIFWVASLGLLVTTSALSFVFSWRIRNVALPQEPDRHATLCWSWRLFNTLRGVLAANIALYAYLSSGDPLGAMALKANLPDYTSQFILLLCYLLMLPTVLSIWKDLGDTVETTLRGLIAVQSQPSQPQP